ncbi:hypothetical protein EVAR_83423_1 [Eumeta japonica]|uniref:Uncharacterized protein n=1 Tax=Eumeta variegata TaxID=151549 RepID=A0A4C1TYN8_EUMVA|nr:hypothetical protein EVAR_83423_1 [Eumeta japonica]
MQILAKSAVKRIPTCRYQWQAIPGGLEVARDRDNRCGRYASHSARRRPGAELTAEFGSYFIYIHCPIGRTIADRSCCRVVFGSWSSILKESLSWYSHTAAAAQNGSARPLRSHILTECGRKLATSAVTFRPVSKSTDGPLPVLPSPLDSTLFDLYPIAPPKDILFPPRRSVTHW